MTPHEFDKTIETVSKYADEIKQETKTHGSSPENEGGGAGVAGERRRVREEAESEELIEALKGIKQVCLCVCVCACVRMRGFEYLLFVFLFVCDMRHSTISNRGCNQQPQTL